MPAIVHLTWGSPIVSRVEALPKRQARQTERHSFMQRFTLNRATTEKPALLLGEVGPRVDRAAIIPHHEVAQLPDMFEYEFAPLADFVKLVKNRSALFETHAFDAGRHQAVDEERLAPGVRVSDEDRMEMMRNAADVA